MKKILITILMSLAILPSMATQVNVRVKSTLPRGGARMPSITQVRADYEGNNITVSIQRYTGEVYVYIYDTNGNVVGTTLANIDADGTFTIDVGNLKGGMYTISIVLSNATYEGTFEVLE